MKIYLVWYDNGESYEDWYEYVVGIFDSFEKAQEKVAKCGYTKKTEDERDFLRNKYLKEIAVPCPCGFASLEQCTIYHESKYPEPSDYYECENLEKRCPYYNYNYSEMRIEERPLE